MKRMLAMCAACLLLVGLSVSAAARPLRCDDSGKDALFRVTFYSADPAMPPLLWFYVPPEPTTLEEILWEVRHSRTPLALEEGYVRYEYSEEFDPERLDWYLEAAEMLQSGAPK